MSNREIKFRAWLPDKREMMYEGFDIKSCIEFHNSNNKDTPVLLMQTTWLKDKAGTEIYEGDYWIHPNGTVYEIYWHDGGFMYGDKDAGVGYYFYEALAQDGEVTGNIYENAATHSKPTK